MCCFPFADIAFTLAIVETLETQIQWKETATPGNGASQRKGAPAASGDGRASFPREIRTHKLQVWHLPMWFHVLPHHTFLCFAPLGW